MSNTNFNIFVGDRSYKRNFFLQFQSNRTERKFREDTLKRNNYALKGFIIFSLLLISAHFTTTDCYMFYHSCGHSYLLLAAMLSAIFALISIYFKTKHIIIQICVLILSVYFHISFLEGFGYNSSLLLITFYTSTASFLVGQVWFLQLFSNLISYGFLGSYIWLFAAYNPIRKSEFDFSLDLALYNLVAALFFGFLEKGRKERWVLVETFKKSDKIFRQLYEELPYAFFVIDKTKRILYSSMNGLTLLSFYFPNCHSCNFSRLNVNLKDILEAEYGNMIDETFQNASPSNPRAEPVACFVTLKTPKEQYDQDTCRFTLEKENLYKVKVIQTIWKANYAYLVVLKDYSSKKKSEKIASKTVNYLSRHVGETINELEFQGVEKRQLKSKSKILSKMMGIRFGIYNTLLLFYRIFNKNEGLKEKKNFNIRASILGTIGFLSFKAKEKGCDLELKFEHSFPIDIYGDEILFQQTFGNVMQMLLEKLKNTNLVINCNLTSVTANGQYVLSFDFKFPKSESMSFDTLSNKIDAHKSATLDNVLSSDDLLFFLSLIKPAVDLFEGKLEVEEHDSDTVLYLRLNMNGSDNSQEKSFVHDSTLRSCNYNASSNPKPHLYVWKSEEPEEAHETENLGKSQVENTSNQLKTSFVNSHKLESPMHSFIRSEQEEIAKRSTQAKQLNGDTFLGRKDQKKVREELQKLSMGGIKNFGSQDSIPYIEKSQSFPNLEVVPKKKDETLKISDQHEEQKLQLPETKEEEEEKEKTQVRKETEENEPANGYQNSYHRAYTGSYTSLPEIDHLGRVQSTFQAHSYSLKLAITKALLEILDEQKRDSLKKNKRSTNIVPMLEGLTLEERVEGVEIKENELCDKALMFLSAKLEDEKDCEEFVMFATQYAKSLEEDIYKLQGGDDMDQSASLPYNSPHAGDSIDSPKMPYSKTSRLDKKGQSSFKLQWSKTKLDLNLGNEFEKPKEKDLNKRFLLTPSLTRAVTLRSGMTLKDKAKDVFAPFLQSPTLTKMKDPSLEETQPLNKKAPEEIYSDLLPFTDKTNLPDFIMYRTIGNKRRWTGAPNEIVNNTPERRFVYNDVFTILAVDDSAFSLQALEALQLKYKKNFEFARNGTEAVKKYLSNINQGILFHLILLDLQMPVMDGFETARVIRAEEANKNFPPTFICAVSAFEDQETINRTRKEGMDNFCQKPIRVEVLNNLILRRCEQIGISPPE